MLQTCQNHERQGRAKDIFPFEGDERDMTVECNA